MQLHMQRRTHTALLVLPEHKEVHGADLCHDVLLAEEPQVLAVAAACCLGLGLDARRIVAAHLHQSGLVCERSWRRAWSMQ